jgi:L-2-hydroxycarboxylate dehydrogenase (NAD+)
MLVREEQMKALYREVILRLGGSESEAETFAEFVVVADLRGMEWQGILSLDKHYVWSIQQGIIKLGQEISVVSEGSSFVVLDAGGELGQVTCSQAMRSVIAKAKDAGIAVAGVRRSGDTGLLASYASMALDHDCIGLLFNTTAPYIAPWGGTERIHGVDPLSVAIPAGEEYPILVDMCLTHAQRYFHRDGSWQRPFPWPDVILFDTVREYALTVVVELICAALTAIPLGGERVHRGETGVVAIAIHVPHFVDMDDFRQRVDGYIRQIKESERADEAKEILLPGERGFREEERRRTHGIPITDDVWAATVPLLDDIGVDWRRLLDEPASADAPAEVS